MKTHTARKPRSSLGSSLLNTTTVSYFHSIVVSSYFIASSVTCLQPLPIMQAPPPVNVKGVAPSAVDGKLDAGPSQEDVHSDIKKLSIEEKGNTENCTSRRLAQTAGSTDGHTFKKTVGTVNGHHTGYVLPSDVDGEAFLRFIEEAKAVVGSDNVIVNYDPEHQAEADYLAQPKFYVRGLLTSIFGSPRKTA